MSIILCVCVCVCVCVEAGSSVSLRPYIVSAMHLNIPLTPFLQTLISSHWFLKFHASVAIVSCMASAKSPGDSALTMAR